MDFNLMQVSKILESSSYFEGGLRSRAWWDTFIETTVFSIRGSRVNFPSEHILLLYYYTSFPLLLFFTMT